MAELDLAMILISSLKHMMCAVAIAPLRQIFTLVPNNCNTGDQKRVSTHTNQPTSQRELFISGSRSQDELDALSRS